MIDSTEQIVWLDDLDLSPILQGWESAKARLSVYGTPLRIGGRNFARGVGTHTVSYTLVKLAGGSRRFVAWVGVDDIVGLGRMVFQVRGDGRLLFDSSVMVGGQAALPVDLDVTGMDALELFVDAVDDMTHHGHADWADAHFVVSGKTPQIIPRPREKAVILTPPPGPAPRLYGARVIGARPGAPMLHCIAATGTRPMRYSAEGLPGNLVLDTATGRITGTVATPGSWQVTVRATNVHGTDTIALSVIIGDEICLTPPLGWNSWNAFGPTVSAEDVRRAAHVLVDSGLVQVGYSYVCIDDGWQGVRSADTDIPYALQANEEFPDMRGLVDEIHALGLKVGIYSVPHVHSCAGFTGGSADTADGRVLTEFQHGGNSHRGAFHYEYEDARQYAAWGFDYLKYDAGPSDDEMREMREALDASGRDIVLSYSANLHLDRVAVVSRYANCWRTTGDLIDTWFSVRAKLRSQRAWQMASRPGHWNDPDMLVIGSAGPGWNAPVQPTRLYPNEQYLHMTMWAMLNAPLLIGGDLTMLDAFTLGVLGNGEVLDINQDALGQQATLLWDDAAREVEIWRKPLADGGLTLALVNLAGTAQMVEVTREMLGIIDPWTVRDLWRQADLGDFGDKWSTVVPHHGAIMLRWKKG